ncbi:MAG: type II toxin-antitoxin system VapC family toxin [Desulfobacterales bacterium]|jgi:tRNA(fMet)-specific endonuclease VapC|nr:type II toxin-antitoxin system VapC family toxin [Desulfobacterales bacterium]
MNYLLDTNVISELISKRSNKKVVEWLDRLDSNTIYLSVITIGEIRKGIEKLPPSKRKERIKEWLEGDLLLRFQGRILEITTEVMLIWGELTGRLEKEGRPITAIDSLIAAIALQGNYRLVTRNEHDFQYTGVTIINPWKES